MGEQYNKNQYVFVYTRGHALVVVMVINNRSKLAKLVTKLSFPKSKTVFLLNYIFLHKFILFSAFLTFLKFTLNGAEKFGKAWNLKVCQNPKATPW